jgi:hypothetical protein
MHSFLCSLQRESMLRLLFLLRYCNSPYRLCAESTFVSNISEKECQMVANAPRTVLIQLLDDVGTRGLKSETKLKKQERPR